MLSSSLLTLTIFMPLVTALVVAFLPKDRAPLIKLVGVVGASATFAVSLVVANAFKTDVAGFQLVEQISWIPSLNVSYFVGIDGMALLLVLLTTFLTPLALLGTDRKSVV
jgi:NADH-quinone oxidoreductase subunit M